MKNTLKCKWHKTLKECLINKKRRPCGNKSECELQYLNDRS